MSSKKESVKVAVVQAAPILFDKGKTVEKAVELIDEAAENGSELVLFPEAFIPAYPRGSTFDADVGNRTKKGRELWQRYYENSVEIPGRITETLGKKTEENEIFLAVGVIEKEASRRGGTLYCTLVYFGPDGNILGKHRKIKPTGTERVIWGEGDGSTLTVVDTDFGKVGGLICWENYMPLARMTMYDRGVEMYLAPTADSRDTWQSTMRHIALEGRCFVLGCNQYVEVDMYPDYFKEEVDDLDELYCRGGSVIVSPMGEVIEGPLYDEEGILYAELDLGEICRSRFDFDVTGHYSRPDIFKLLVNEEKQENISKRK
ncbi:MAG: carbon-nitrogen hydrolase family protein [Thermoplasmata archaeon]